MEENPNKNTTENSNNNMKNENKKIIIEEIIRIFSNDEETYFENELIYKFMYLILNQLKIPSELITFFTEEEKKEILSTYNFDNIFSLLKNKNLSLTDKKGLIEFCKFILNNKSSEIDYDKFYMKMKVLMDYLMVYNTIPGNKFIDTTGSPYEIVNEDDSFLKIFIFTEGESYNSITDFTDDIRKIIEEEIHRIRMIENLHKATTTHGHRQPVTLRVNPNTRRVQLKNTSYIYNRIINQVKSNKDNIKK